LFKTGILPRNWVLKPDLLNEKSGFRVFAFLFAWFSGCAEHQCYAE
jgi:hypothetical protein